MISQFTVFCRARVFSVIFLTLSIVVIPELVSSRHRASAVSGTIYYVDCTGNDSNNGKTPSQAWKSLEKANSAPLIPGDWLLLKRDCLWTGTLKASWNGTPTQPILIGAYGKGTLPKIQNGPTDLIDKYHNNVDVTGSYQIIEYIETTIVNPPVDPGCLNNPVGFYIGFNFRNPKNLPDGGSHNLLRYSQASGHTAGAHLNTNTYYNRIIRNTFTDNHVMNRLTPISVDPVDDIGAWGILLKGSHQEVAFNRLSNNNSWCTYDTFPQGNAIELYEARDNTIHHNISVNDRVFSELGGTPAIRSDNNIYIYNLVISSIPESHFIVARGDGNIFGPTYRTKLFNNTVYYTGPESQGIICHSGCSGDIMTAKNNIIWAEWKAAFGDAPFKESNNIFWSSDGTPFVQFMGFNISPTSSIANPQFIDPVNGNFRIKSTSPAIDAGINTGWKKDLDCVSIPQGAGYDIGAYEYPVASTPEPTPNQQKAYLPLVYHQTLMISCHLGEK